MVAVSGAARVPRPHILRSTSVSIEHLQNMQLEKRSHLLNRIVSKYSGTVILAWFWGQTSPLFSLTHPLKYTQTKNYLSVIAHKMLDGLRHLLISQPLRPTTAVT